jgi:hypothetical protein
MEEFEQSIAAILTQNHESFSTMAKQGFAKHGRGAVFIWVSEEQGARTTFRSSYVASTDPAFQKSGPHPTQMVGEYTPGTEFVAVFVTPDESVHSFKVDLAKEEPQSYDV